LVLASPIRNINAATFLDMGLEFCVVTPRSTVRHGRRMDQTHGRVCAA
jgi:hypothetical protein